MKPFGKLGIQPVYREVLEFSDQIAAVKNSGNWNLINFAGRNDSSSTWESVKPFKKMGWGSGNFREILLDQ